LYRAQWSRKHWAKNRTGLTVSIQSYRFGVSCTGAKKKNDFKKTREKNQKGANPSTHVGEQGNGLAHSPKSHNQIKRYTPLLNLGRDTGDHREACRPQAQPKIAAIYPLLPKHYPHKATQPEKKRFHQGPLGFYPQQKNHVHHLAHNQTQSRIFDIRDALVTETRWTEPNSAKKISRPNKQQNA